MFNIAAVIYMHMADCGFVVLEHIYHFVQKLGNPFALTGGCRNYRYAYHGTQTAVIQRCIAPEQFIVHIEGHYDLQVHIDERGSQKEIPFEICGIHYVYNHIGHFFRKMGAHIKFFGRIFRKGISPGKVRESYGISLMSDSGCFYIHGDAAIIAYALVRTGCCVEKRSLPAVRITYKGHVYSAYCGVVKTVLLVG